MLGSRPLRNTGRPEGLWICRNKINPGNGHPWTLTAHAVVSSVERPWLPPALRLRWCLGLRTAAAEASSGNCPTMPQPMKDVAGKVAFITGGDSGIGLGIARAFADAGMKVVITYRTKSHLDEAMELLKPAGDRIHAVNLDVTDRAAFEKAAVETVDKFKKVHVIVNTAGVGIVGGLGTATYDDWDWGMGVNANGVFNGIRTFPAAHSVAR